MIEVVLGNLWSISGNCLSRAGTDLAYNPFSLFTLHGRHFVVSLLAEFLTQK